MRTKLMECISAQSKDRMRLGISILMFLGMMLATVLTGGQQASAQNTNSIFGPNVYIYDSTIPATTITSSLNTLNTNAQFDTRRYAVLFMPGTYTGVEAEVGYYESVAGLGAIPSAVHINNGYLNSNQVDSSGNITTNFWRSIENMQITAPSGSYQWGVSQGSPFRRMIVDNSGGLELTNSSCGDASGGFISNTVVTGNVAGCSQQQWYTRNSTIGSWSGDLWNMVFSGVQGAPSPNYPTNRYTVLPTTPVSREKPFIYVDDSSGDFSVFVPAPLPNSSGTTWANASGSSATSMGNEPGYSLPISSFLIATPSTTLGAINAALAAGQNLILTPGIYQYSGSINITNPNTIVLGLGYATLIPQTPTAAITVADVDGVQIAGLIIDAGPAYSPVLLQIGVYGAPRVSHAGNPTTINDVFFRIGGAEAGSAATSLEIDSDNVILDDIWAWRADHGAGASPIWTGNPGINGVIVNGDNVTALGLAVEHYEGAQVLWNGNGGETIFYQSELPYDVPLQTSWMDGSANGYPSYVVSSAVTSHMAYGLGVYSYFDQGIAITDANAITVPSGVPGVAVTDAVSVFLSGSGGITATVDGVGTPAVSGSITSYVPFYGVTCITTNTCPAAPTGLAAYAIGSTQINLAWTAISTPGALYSVYRSTSAGFTPSASTLVANGLTLASYADGGLTAGTTYYYVVEATSAYGSSPASTQAFALTPTNIGGQITNYFVSIDSGCGTAAKCTAAGSGGQKGDTLPAGWVYDTSTYLSGGPTQSQVAETIVNPAGTVNWVPNNVYNSYTHGGSFTYTITGLTQGASYIVALDFAENYAGGNSATYREFNVAINGTQVLKNFSIYGTTGALYTATVQSFYAFADATGTITISFSSGADNSPTVDGIQVGTGANMPAPLVAATGLTANTVSDTEANLTWTASSIPNAVYEVFRSTTAGFTPSNGNLITTTTGTTFTDTTLTPGITYYYLVVASDGLFSSLPSNQATLSTPVGPAASVAAIAGSGQTTVYGANFANPLTVIAQDAFGNLVSGATVTFAGNGISFPSGNTAETGSNGQAVITALASATGPLTATASVGGGSNSANFSETGTAASQSINFTAPASPVTYGVAPITLSATATSGLPVAFNVTGPATVNGSILTVTGAGTVYITASQAGNADYAAAPQAQQSLTVNPAVIKVTANSPTITYGAALPTYTASYSGFQSTDTASVLSGAPSLTTNPASPVAAGQYPIIAALGTLSAANYTFAFVNGTLTINKAQLTVTANNLAIAYGAALPAYTASYSGFQLTDTAGVLSGVPSLTSTATATSAAGKYPIIAALGTLSAANYTFAFVNGTLTIGQALSGSSVTSNLNPAFVQNAVTLTASVGFAATGTPTASGPTGTVTFLDGTTPLCSGVALGAPSPTTGVAMAACSTSTLSAASHSVTANYSGDSNFTASTSAALTETVVDFGFSTQEGSFTLVPGASGQYSFTVSPASPATTFPAVVSLSVGGLPAGATATLTPSSIAAGAGSTTVQMAIKLPAMATARPANSLGRTLAPFSLALLLLPFAGRLRRASKKLNRLLSILLLAGMGLAAAAGMSGCGSQVGFFGQSQKSYTVTVTGTSGNLSRTIKFTLDVE